MSKSIEKRRFETYTAIPIDEAIEHPEEVLKQIGRNPYQRPIKEWQYIPSVSELEELRKFAYDRNSWGNPEDDRNYKDRTHGKQGCPECKTGRLVMTNEGSNVGTALVLRCKWGAKDCPYELDITDYGMW